MDVQIHRRSIIPVLDPLSYIIQLLGFYSVSSTTDPSSDFMVKPTVRTALSPHEECVYVTAEDGTLSKTRVTPNLSNI